tara:strand:+ start:127 stop:324 length:198 start_codon:yes stop_codon:yes gene_type:complete
MNTYTVRQSQKIYRYTTVEAKSKAEALKQVEDGYADFDDVTEQDNATFKVTGMSVSSDMTRLPWE